MSTDVHLLESHCQPCRRSRAFLKHRRLPTLFLLLKTLKFHAINIFLTFMQAKQGNIFAVALTDRFYMTLKAAFVDKSTAPNVATIISKKRVVFCKAPDVFFANHGS